MMIDRDWMRLAACVGKRTDVWFPEPPEESPLANLICSACTVQADCREYALSHGEKFGIWGGLGERERRRMFRRGRLEKAS